MYQKALEEGYEEAAYDLARLYEDGLGVEKSLEKAIFLYYKAVAQYTFVEDLALQALRMLDEKGYGELLEKVLGKDKYSKDHGWL